MTDELDLLYQNVTRRLHEHLEALAAAYLKATDIDPRDAVLVCEQDHYNYRFYFRARDPLPDRSRDDLLAQISRLAEKADTMEAENARLQQLAETVNKLLKIGQAENITDIAGMVEKARLLDACGFRVKTDDDGRRYLSWKRGMVEHSYYPDGDHMTISTTIKDGS